MALANYSDADGDALSVMGITRLPQNGTAMVLADGSIRYTPAAGFLGRDRFRYRITDGKGKYESAWVSVTVQYRNRRSSYLETRPFTAQEGGARLHSSVMVL